MNRAETWRHSARQRSEQRIEALAETLERLRRNQIRDGREAAELIAQAMIPVAEALGTLTVETDETIRTCGQAAQRTLEDLNQNAEALAALIGETRSMLEQARQARKEAMRRWWRGALTATVILLPFVGWLSWWASQAPRQETRSSLIVKGMARYLSEHHPELPREKAEIEKLFIWYGIMSEKEKVAPNL